jgi:hypothetical protein
MPKFLIRGPVLSSYFVLFIFFPSLALANFGLSLGGGYSNTRLEHKSDTQSFSLSSESGSRANGELSLGYGVIEFYAVGVLHQANFEPPATKTILEPKLMTTDVGGGFRYKFNSGNIFVGYLSSEHPYLTEIDSSQFELKKVRIPLAFFGAQVSAWTRDYTISLRAFGGTQVGSVQVPGATTETTYQYMASGDALIEYGKYWKVGAIAGADARSYKVEANTVRQEFFMGLFFRMGGSGNGFANEKYSPLFGN